MLVPYKFTKYNGIVKCINASLSFTLPKSKNIASV